MARGKYRHRSCAQRIRALHEEIDALHAEVDREERALCLAREHADRTRAARRRLRTETVRSTATLAPHEADAARTAAAATDAWHVLHAAVAELERADRAISSPRQGQGRRELFAAAVAGGFVLDNRPVAHAASSPEYQELACRARLGATTPMRRSLDMTGWVPADVGATRAEIAPYAEATPQDRTREALWSFVVPPWTRLPDGHDAPALRAELGATTSGAADLPAGSFPAQPPCAMTIDRPWRHTPWLPLPEDAADLNYWYHRAAWAQNWSSDHSPVPLWLPAEHSSGFPRAKPLPNQVDLRLPFPVVCSLFAEPWQLPASKPAADLPFATMLLARGPTAGSRIDPVSEHRRRVLVGRDELPSPLEAVEHFGAQVEGLLFRADHEHRPTDDFAWCVSLSHPWGLPLGRVVIPAHRSLTAWSLAVDNVLAGICLSHWHTAETNSSAPTPQAHAQHGTRGEVDVRVLDIAATSPGQSAHAALAGSSRRTHLRRGTWRWPMGRTRPHPPTPHLGPRHHRSRLRHVRAPGLPTPSARVLVLPDRVLDSRPSTTIPFRRPPRIANRLWPRLSAGSRSRRRGVLTWRRPPRSRLDGVARRPAVGAQT